MHRTRKTDDRTTRPVKRLDLRRETLRRLDPLSEADLRRAIGGARPGDHSPSMMPTGDSDGC